MKAKMTQILVELPRKIRYKHLDVEKDTSNITLSILPTRLTTHSTF